MPSAPAARRGRPPSLRGRALQDVVIAQGLTRFTMAGVARHLGVAEGTVYNYVSSRDELLAQSAEACIADIDLVGPEDSSWCEYLVVVSRALDDLCRRHRGLADVYLHGPYTTGFLGMFDLQVEQLRRRGVEGEDEAFALASFASTTTLTLFGDETDQSPPVGRFLEPLLRTLRSTIERESPALGRWSAVRDRLWADAHPSVR